MRFHRMQGWLKTGSFGSFAALRPVQIVTNPLHRTVTLQYKIMKNVNRSHWMRIVWLLRYRCIQNCLSYSITPPKNYTQQWGLCSFQALKCCNTETDWIMAVKAKRGRDRKEYQLNIRAFPFLLCTKSPLCYSVMCVTTEWKSNSQLLQLSTSHRSF